MTFRGFALVAMLTASTVCSAQPSAPPGANWEPMNQPIDTRLGVFRPAPTASQPAAGQAQTREVASLSDAGQGRDYRIGPNDVLEVEVLDLDKDNSKRTVRVNTAGAVSLPLIGPVVVAGLSAQQAESRIAARYSEKYLQNAQVSVFIKEFTTERITLDGAVAKPGIYPLTGQITLLRALALAGGFGSIANPNEVMLFRQNQKGEREMATFDVDLIRAGKSEDPLIKGDDLIVVQRDPARRALKDSMFRDILDTLNPFTVFKN
jgi:polysaccharide biosynthesis/export protein